MNDVREGTLDFVLTKPEDSQVLVSVREVRIWQTVDIVDRARSCSRSACASSDRGIGPVQAAAFVAARCCWAALMIYCFWLILTTGAFWIVRMDEIHELFEGIYQSGRWPVTIYPGWLRISLTFLVPIAFAVTVPAEALTSRLTLETLALAAVFAVALLRRSPAGSGGSA